MINSSSLAGPSDGILHFGAIRVRVTGTGNLIPIFSSLDTVKTQTLRSIMMQPATDVEPVKLANFKTQRAFLKLGTTQQDEIFRISRVIIFVRGMWTEHPK